MSQQSCKHTASCFPAHASIPHSRNRGYRCLKNFLWKEKFITYKGNSLSKHFVLASAWGRGPQHSSLVRRYNEVHGSKTEVRMRTFWAISFLTPTLLKLIVMAGHLPSQTIRAAWKGGEGKRRKETVQRFTSLKITHITCWLLGFATGISQYLSIHSAAVSLWTTIFQGAIWFLRQV